MSDTLAPKHPNPASFKTHGIFVDDQQLWRDENTVMPRSLYRPADLTLTRGDAEEMARRNHGGPPWWLGAIFLLAGAVLALASVVALSFMGV